MENEKLVTLRQYDNSVQAHIDRVRLESEGIQCFIQDEHMVTMNWLYSNLVGGIKLQVTESDFDRAVEILEENYLDDIQDFSDEYINDSQEDLTKRCPRCDSNNTYREKFSRKAFFVSLIFLFFPVPFLKPKWKCLDCNYEWKD